MKASMRPKDNAAICNKKEISVNSYTTCTIEGKEGVRAAIPLV